MERGKSEGSTKGSLLVVKARKVMQLTCITGAFNPSVHAKFYHFHENVRDVYSYEI